MSEARHKTLLRKSIAACVAAIEIYNKPVMSYREETFATLAITAWELLLKARLLREANNKLRSIQVLVPIQGKGGQATTRMRVDLNRAGNPRTIPLGVAIQRASQLPKLPLDPACAANIGSLVEIRDNGVHFFNSDPEVLRRVYEAGCACIRNYVAAIGEWFDQDLSNHRFMILPLSFEAATGPATVVAGRRSRQQANLLALLDQASEDHPMLDNRRYSAAVQIEARIVGSRAKDAIALRLGAGPGAPEVRLTEEQIADRYPMDYRKLVTSLRGRLPGFKTNTAFHQKIKAIKGNPRFVFRRHIDPGDPKSQSREFYSQAAADVLAQQMKAPAGG